MLAFELCCHVFLVATGSYPFLYCRLSAHACGFNSFTLPFQATSYNLNIFFPRASVLFIIFTGPPDVCINRIQFKVLRPSRKMVASLLEDTSAYTCILQFANPQLFSVVSTHIDHKIGVMLTTEVESRSA